MDTTTAPSNSWSGHLAGVSATCPDVSIHQPAPVVEKLDPRSAEQYGLLTDQYCLDDPPGNNRHHQNITSGRLQAY